MRVAPQVEIAEAYSVVNDPSLMSLIDNLINNFLKTQPAHVRQHADEIRSYVICACWEREHTYDPYVAKSTTYFRRRISGAILDWMREASPFKRSFKKHHPNVKMHVFSGAGEKDSDCAITTGECNDKLLFSTIKSNPQDESGEVDLSDFIQEKFQLQPRQLQIIKLRRLKYTNKEIGRMLGYSETTVSNIIRKIRSSFEEYRDTEEFN